MKKNQTCIVRDCDSSEIKNSELKFYPIPKEENVKKKWLKAINRSQDELTKRSKVCSKHFKSTDYTVTRFNYTMGDKNEAGTDKSVCEWKVLKTEVVPSLNLPEKSTFKIKISKKDNSKEVKVEEVKVKEEKDKEKPQRMPKRPAPPPVEVTRETPSRSRRQASKEALKQMQLLLDDENDAVEIASDEDFSYLDIIPIDPVPPPPPKKKYKLSHRKSSDINADREVLVLKSITNRNAENTLELDCWVEPLEECQAARIKKIQDEEKEIQSKLDSLVSKGNAKVIHKGDLSTIIEISEYVQSAIQAAQVPSNPSPVVLNKALASNQSYQLVMDPRLRLIAVNQNTPTTTPPVSTPQKVYQGKVQVAQNLHPTPTTSTTNQTRMRTRRGVVGGGVSSPPPQTPVVNTPPITTRSGLQTRSMPAKNVPPAPASKTVTPTRTQITTRSTPLSNKSTPVAKHPPPVKKAIPVATPPPPVTRTRQSSSASTTNIRPSEENVEGGLATGGGAGAGQAKKVVVDLTSEDGKAMPDSKEIAFNKLQGKTYPSLVVVARPHLRVQDVSVDRPKLDAKVKSVLMHAPTKFTEWLIQQGLVRSEQKCSTHTSTQLKLGMYSDVTKFPYSGGYVWISECCPHRFVSVFSGSLFEGSPHPPMVILKLLYHWACQTNIQNVTQWVKVDNLYVKGMFTWLRGVTTVALHTHLRPLGGPGIKVEVGVISLGTTSQDGNQRQVKVEVLGVLETTSKLIRLRAVEPQTEGDRNYKKRFSKILEPIQQWVHPESTLVADLTVDKQTLNNMGFTNVVQSSSSDYGQNNRQVMEYLRRIVPRMFQNTLSLLSRQIIQQFLDELVWREWYGNTSLQAFDNLVLHLAEQTRYDSSTLINRLNRVAQFPFKNWALPSSVITNQNATSTTKPTDNASSNQKKQRNRKQELNTKPAQQLSTSKTVQQVPVEINRPPKSISPDLPEQMVPLENYYYGTIDNYTKTPKITLNMKCPFCKSVFDNNIQLMNHLFKHAHNVSQDAQLCRYCLTSVPTANDLLKHIATSHPAETKFDNGFVCLICETQYMNPFILGKHMSKEHCPSELPYQCGTCGYRCSNHKQAIDHFYKTHDNGPTIQCPFCLKSTTVFTSSRNINQNMNYFIQHLQKHQRKQFARRCGKCNLWFVQKDVLRDHQARMHVSQRGKPRLVPWNAPRNGVMVPKSKMDKYPGDADVINFTTLTLDVEKNLMCKECNTSMNTPKHFPSFESCQNPNCQYSTCCTNAMQEHNAKCSKTQTPIEKEKLPYEMFCICGYSDTDGNQMARHLAICERKSAYPSRAEAQAAIVTHSMLDVLGLVRKPEETKKDEADVASVALDNDVKDDDVSIVSTSTEKMEVDEKTEAKSEENLENVEKVTSGSKRLLDESEATETAECDKTLERSTRFSKRRKLNPDTGESVKINEDSKASTATVSENIDEINETTTQEVPEEKIKDNVEETNKAIEEVSRQDCQPSDAIDEGTKAVGELSETKDKEVDYLKENTENVEEKQESDSKEESIQENVAVIEGAASTSKEEESVKVDAEVIEEAVSSLKEEESVKEDAEVIEKAESLSKEPVKEDAEISGEEKTSSTNIEESTEKITDNVEEEKIQGKEIECKIEEILNQELPNVNNEESSNIESIEDKSETTAEDPIHAEEVTQNVETPTVEAPRKMPSTDENEKPVVEDQIKAEAVKEENTSVYEENSEMTSESPERKQPDESNSGDKKIVGDLVESTFKSLEDRAIEEFGILNSEGDDEDDQDSQVDREAHDEDQDSQVDQEVHDEDQDSQVDQEAHDEDQDSQVDQEAHDEDQDSQVDQEAHDDQDSQVDQKAHDEDHDSQVDQGAYDEDQDIQVDQEAHDADQDSQIDQEAHDEDPDSQVDQEAHNDQATQEPHVDKPTSEDIEPTEDNKEQPENLESVKGITKHSEIVVENASNHIQEDKVDEDCRIEIDADDNIPMDDNNKSQDAPDITTDDIHNFISDIVGENETDITTRCSDTEPASKNFDVSVTMAASAAMEVIESEEATPMDTD